MVRGWVPSDAGITAREAEVLAALAEHLTNAEIAARLFISVRTVESHVSSLLRKLQVDDRRALAAVAATLHRRAATTTVDTVATAMPVPLTSFVGRVAERAALAREIETHRLVTAVGPGGVGKTRLALSVAGDMTGRFADGVWYVDLVPVTDPAMIAPAIAAAIGLGEHQGRSAEDTVIGWLALRETLLVLDNCEHMLDGVVALLERLLLSCPRLTVLATSQARLLVPFEWVFAVPALSVDGGAGDAVELFLARAAAGGGRPADEERPRIAAICRALDGMALAIELAASRLASLGLDGLEAGFADWLQLLAGGRRAEDRHRSLRAALDWSYGLLDEVEQAVLRRASVFAAPFAVSAAQATCSAWPPVPREAIPTVLGSLTERSLLTAIVRPIGTRYRLLETVRQYGADRLRDAGESVAAFSRHLDWCLTAGTALLDRAGGDGGTWRSEFDDVADELRAALAWASDNNHHRPEAYRLAVVLADLTFVRGMPGESQRRYEQAARFAADDGAAATALRSAAGAAEVRAFGNEALRLRRAAASAAVRAGDKAGAAKDLAQAAELINRGPGLLATSPGPGEVHGLLADARRIADGDAATEARILTAEAFDHPDPDPATVRLAERAIALARQAGDVLTESAALDQLTANQLALGDVRAAVASATRRLELLAPLQMTAAAGLEFSDAFMMAAECAIAAGDLRTARRLAEQVRDLPVYREEGHLATARLIVVTVLSGEWDEAVALAERFREGWERAGRPRVGHLSRGAYAAATVCGLRGDEGGRAEWLRIVEALVTPGRPLSAIHFDEFFDALLLLHRGLPEEAMRRLQTPPEEFRSWHNGLWRPWYAALWAEAAVITRDSEAADRIRRARRITADNPIAAAIVDRAAALAGDRHSLAAAATALRAAGCRYQWARTQVLLGGEERAQGQSTLAEMGATPMAITPR